MNRLLRSVALVTCVLWPASALPADADGEGAFDFFHGRWHAKNRRLVKWLQGSQEWETFESTNDVKPLRAGLGLVDEISFAAWKPGLAGVALHLFNPGTKKWTLHWADNRTGELQSPVSGAFAGGVGIFEGTDTLDARPILVRNVWKDITPTSLRWEQSFSADQGRTWEINWTMDLTRSDGQASRRSPARAE